MSDRDLKPAPKGSKRHARVKGDKAGAVLWVDCENGRVSSGGLTHGLIDASVVLLSIRRPSGGASFGDVGRSGSDLIGA